MERLSWRILVCTLNQRVRVGVFPMGFGAHGAVLAQVSHIVAGWAATTGTAEGRRRHFLHSANRLPMESGSPRVWLRQFLAPLLPRVVDATSSISSEATAAALRRAVAASNGSGKVSTARPPRLPWAGKKTGPNPTDRGKSGVKRSMLTDGRGVPLGLAVDGANRHDQKLFLRDARQHSASPSPPDFPPPATSLLRQGIRRGRYSPRSPATARHAAHQVPWRRTDRQASLRPPCPTLGRRAAALVDESFSADSRSLGKEGGKLPSFPPFRLCVYHLESNVVLG